LAGLNSKINKDHKATIETFDDLLDLSNGFSFTNKSNGAYNGNSNIKGAASLEDRFYSVTHGREMSMAEALDTGLHSILALCPYHTHSNNTRSSNAVLYANHDTGRPIFTCQAQCGCMSIRAPKPFLSNSIPPIQFPYIKGCILLI